MILVVMLLSGAAFVPFPPLFMAPSIIKCLILLRVWDSCEVKRASPLVVILMRCLELFDQGLILIVHRVIMKVSIWLACTTTDTELGLRTFKLSLPFSFNPASQLTVIDRFAQSFDMHIIHRTLSLEGFAWAALSHLFLLFGSFLATSSYDHTSAISWVFQWSCRSFRFMRARWSLATIHHWGFRIQLEFLLGLSMLGTFRAAPHGENWEVGEGHMPRL